MKNSVVNPPVSTRIGRASGVAKNAKIIHCSFCNNTFSAVPRDAVCLKCKRPANRSLSWANRLLCLILFPIGLLKSALMRASNPYAASQALICSLLGGGLWSAVLLVVLQS